MCYSQSEKQRSKVQVHSAGSDSTDATGSEECLDAELPGHPLSSLLRMPRSAQEITTAHQDAHLWTDIQPLTFYICLPLGPFSDI